LTAEEADELLYKSEEFLHSEWFIGGLGGGAMIGLWGAKFAEKIEDF
jgi:hypothetical protein